MNPFSQVLTYADTILELALLGLLLVGPFRKYLVFSLYIAGLGLGDVVGTIAYYRRGLSSSAYYDIYWTDRIGSALLLFAVVIAFTYEALRESPLRAKAAKALAVIFLVTLALPFAFLREHYSGQHGFFSSKWFNEVSQIWSFGAAIMNLVLWTALLSNRRRDPKLVIISIGLGLLTASAAIGWGSRQWFPEADRWPVDTFRWVSHLASLLIWCWAFRPSARPVPRPTPPNALTTPS